MLIRPIAFTLASIVVSLLAHTAFADDSPVSPIPDLPGNPHPVLQADPTRNHAPVTMQSLLARINKLEQRLAELESERAQPRRAAPPLPGPPSMPGARSQRPETPNLEPPNSAYPTPRLAPQAPQPPQSDPRYFNATPLPVPPQPTPYDAPNMPTPNGFPRPNTSVPNSWQRFQFNGQWFYIVPVDQTDGRFGNHLR
ncbi:hypothetical protein [Novipirellula artificiosorum]|uniref:Uncharacterized protein n=1 Tax=Novipirellula artificiosorum TaxID=2528016 RepID=A0A5C6E3H5_9BACT|nr:hypothetical protein [Novipirellula artificiosorum]TWU42527.1 hypothetical protein Poly41_08240 [Novipirellula artificiosorum]